MLSAAFSNFSAKSAAIESCIPSTIPLPNIKKDPQKVQFIPQQSNLSFNSLAIESCTPPTQYTKKIQPKIQFAAEPPKRVRYNRVPAGYEERHEEPRGISIPKSSPDWNGSDEARLAVNALITVADKLPAPIHNFKDNVTDYSKSSSFCWSKARDAMAADAEAKIEKYRMQCTNPYQEASRTGSPYYTGVPVKPKEARICPEILPIGYNVRDLNCNLWRDLERQLGGTAEANRVWKDQMVEIEKEEERNIWLKKGDMETRYQRRIEVVRSSGMRLGQVMLEEGKKEVESTCPRHQEEDTSLVPSADHSENKVTNIIPCPEEKETSDSDDTNSDDSENDSETRVDGCYTRQSRVLHIRSPNGKDDLSLKCSNIKHPEKGEHSGVKVSGEKSYCRRTEDPGYRSFNLCMGKGL
jgi:hypothetical protein